MSRIGQSIGRMLSPALLVFFYSGMVRAQSPTGRIVGNVADPSEAPIPDAKVTVTNIATKVTQAATTGNDGSIRFLPCRSAPTE
jgi:hypothetical protein